MTGFNSAFLIESSMVSAIGYLMYREFHTRFIICTRCNLIDCLKFSVCFGGIFNSFSKYLRLRISAEDVRPSSGCLGEQILGSINTDYY